MLRVTQRARRQFGVLAIAVVLACDEGRPSLPGEPIAETRDLIVYGDGTGGALCGGTTAAWQAHIEAIASHYDGAGPREKIRVLLTNRPEDYCDSEVAGCAYLEDEPALVVSTASSIKHELAHAASVPLFGAGEIPFLREGFAEAWFERSTTLPREDLVPYISANQSNDVRYAAAAHFLHWLEDEYGATMVTDLIAGSNRKDDDRERFEGIEGHLGGAFEGLQLAFWSTAHLYVPGFGRCSDDDGGPDFTLNLSNVVEFDVVLDCAGDALGPFPYAPVGDGGRPYVARRVDVTEAGIYQIDDPIGDAVLLPCDALDDALDAAFWASQEAILRDQGPARMSRRLALRAGRYQLWVIGPPGAASEHHVTIWPSLSLSRRVGRE